MDDLVSDSRDMLEALASQLTNETSQSFIAGNYTIDPSSGQGSLICSECHHRLHWQWFHVDAFSGEPPVCVPCLQTALRNLGFASKFLVQYNTIDRQPRQDRLHCMNCSEDRLAPLFEYDLATGTATICTACSASNDFGLFIVHSSGSNLRRVNHPSSDSASSKASAHEPTATPPPSRFGPIFEQINNTSGHHMQLSNGPNAVAASYDLRPSSERTRVEVSQQTTESRRGMSRCSRHRAWMDSRLFTPGKSICNACIADYHRKNLLWEAQGLCTRGGCAKEDIGKKHCNKHAVQMRKWGVTRKAKQTRAADVVSTLEANGKSG